MRRLLEIILYPTELRFSDFTSLKETNFTKTKNGVVLRVNTQKTRKKAEIPLVDRAVKIAKKYNYTFNHYINQVFNKSIKDFYGDNLSVTDEEKETLDAKLYPKFTLEKSVPSEPEESTYITVQDVAEYLQISEQGVRKHIKIGNLKAKQIGKLYRIKESDFSEFLAKRRTH